MLFLYLKAFHIIFVVTWFAGLFYIVRLFIYHVEAKEKSQEEFQILSNQFSIMERRLWYGITWPSAILTLIFGFSLASQFWPWTSHPWLLIKLSFVLGLFIYHLAIGKIFQKLQKNQPTPSAFSLRVINEVATLFLFAIVFLVVLKSGMGLLQGILSLLLLALVLVIAIKIYRQLRKS
jgi:putative membrane protein